MDSLPSVVPRPPQMEHGYAPPPPPGPLEWSPPHRVERPSSGGPASCQEELDLEEDLAECIAAWQEKGWQDSLPRQVVCSPLGRPRLGAHVSRRSSEDYVGEQDSGPVLTVNIGGVIFRTMAKTLRKAPFFDSMLRHTQDGALGSTVDDSGTLFVDRSGELFVYILEYLRTGHWILRERAGDLEFVDALREEAGFYGLSPVRDRLPLPRISEYVTVWQFRDDTSLYVDCLEQTIREDPDNQGLFRLCKYSGGLPLDMQTCTKRFKATSHNIQAVIAYFAMRGFNLQHVIEGSMMTHTFSASGQSRSGHGTQYVLSRKTIFPDS